MRELVGHTSFVQGLAFAPDGDTVYVSGEGMSAELALAEVLDAPNESTPLPPTPPRSARRPPSRPR